MVNLDDVVEHTNLPYKLLKRGKVRDIYQINEEELLMVSTDRISAFDIVLPNPIPQKGVFLNNISYFFLNFVNERLGIKTHLCKSSFLEGISQNIIQRSSIVKKSEVIKVECIARGYLLGSLYNEYKQHNTINGMKPEREYKFGDALPTVLFTPTTKEETGHDKPITVEDIRKIYGERITEYIVNNTLKIYQFCKEFLLTKGIILVDTKLEWGLLNNEIILIDEVLTPDSSRYWLKEDVDAGKISDFYDKQMIRDYLNNIGWNKKPPAPKLPIEIIYETARRYELIYKKIINS